MMMIILSMRRQSFDLQRCCDLHKDLQFVVLNVDHSLVHELKQGRHYLVSHILEDYCRVCKRGAESRGSRNEESEIQSLEFWGEQIIVN